MMLNLENYGYIPGTYLNICMNCNNQYMGYKRSIRCEACAHKKALKEYEHSVSEWKKEISGMPQSIIISKCNNEAKLELGDYGYRCEVCNAIVRKNECPWTRC